MKFYSQHFTFCLEFSRFWSQICNFYLQYDGTKITSYKFNRSAQSEETAPSSVDFYKNKFQFIQMSKLNQKNNKNIVFLKSILDSFTNRRESDSLPEMSLSFHRVCSFSSDASVWLKLCCFSSWRGTPRRSCSSRPCPQQRRWSPWRTAGRWRWAGRGLPGEPNAEKSRNPETSRRSGSSSSARWERGMSSSGKTGNDQGGTNAKIYR